MKDCDLRQVKKFYDERFLKKGEVLESVGWGSCESQHLRFEVLLRNINFDGKKILDVGCGFGDLIPFLESINPNFEYVGIDISLELLKVAKDRYKNKPNISFYEGDILSVDQYKLEGIDISVLSGTLTYKISDNIAYAQQVLNKMYEVSKTAAASNFMSSYADYKNDKNYHFSPEELFSYSKSLFGKVVLFHDYPLHEFTIQIFK